MRRRRLFLPADALAGYDPNVVRPAIKEELLAYAMCGLFAAFVALIVCLSHSWTLLYGDAVAHLGTARRVLDSREPGLAQLGGVWLPLPHLVMLPLVQKIEWWQNGMAGTWPSMIFYLFGVVGFYRLARRMLVPRWATAATAFFGLNPNLLYLATTAMTEPLFLTLMIWLVVITVECLAALDAGTMPMVRRRLLQAGLLIVAAVYTRYDGWVLGAVVWCLLTVALLRRGKLNRAGWAFRGFTLLTVAAPLGWFWYNAHFYHDPLDFMRGPYSAAAILQRTTPPGSRPYVGWHAPFAALKLYLQTSQGDIAVKYAGIVMVALALLGTGLAWVKKLPRAAVLLWVPLPFYVYSISYGSVPIFIPDVWPHSYYNTRYGMEMLPVLALFSFVAIAAGFEWVRTRGKGGELTSRLAQPIMLLLIALNVVGMMAKTPLVLKEAQMNAATRVPFEHALAQTLLSLPPNSPILMSGSDHVGALQLAAIPLRRTVNEGDYYEWRSAMQDPAHSAAFVIALDGDPIDVAVKAHPDGLSEVSIFHSSGQPTTRVYHSEVYGK